MAGSLSEDINVLSQLQMEAEAEKMLLIEKGLKSENPEDIVKAMQESEKYFQGSGAESKNQKSYLQDPFYFSDSLGYKQKPTNVNDYFLRRMSFYPLVKAVIQTRVEQVVKFSDVQPDRFSTGFVIKKRRRPWEEQKDLSSDDKKVISYLTDFILFCGTGENKWHGDDFDAFLRKVVSDSLSMDKLTFEVIRNKKGIPVEFLATDSATMYYADKSESERNSKKINGHIPEYCQVYDNKILADFYPWELCFGIRNPQTDMRFNGYGRSELEDLIATVTSMIWSDEYNSRFFSQGSVPKGIMKVSQNISKPKLHEFKQEWMAMMQGVYNSHRTAILEAEKFEWQDLQKTNRDMEFSKWQEYLIKVTCAVYKMDPSEIGFSTGGGVEQKSLFEANNEYKLKYSTDKGLTPILKFIQYQINKYIIWEINPDYEFCFEGINAETQQQEEERLLKASEKYMEVNEVRKIKGLPEKPEYNMIANPVLMQAKQMSMYGDPESNSKIDEESSQVNGDGTYADTKQNRELNRVGEPYEKGFAGNPMWLDVEEFIQEELTA